MSTDHDHDPLWAQLEAKGLTRPKYPDPNRPRDPGPALNDDEALAAKAAGVDARIGRQLDRMAAAERYAASVAAPAPQRPPEDPMAARLAAAVGVDPSSVPGATPAAPRQGTGGGGARPTTDPRAYEIPGLRNVMPLADPLAEQLRRALDLSPSDFR